MSARPRFRATSSLGARKTCWTSRFIDACIRRGSFARIFRIVCTWQRCRKARGHIRLTAFLRPGAPSKMTISGSFTPRALRSCRKPSHASYDSRGPKARCSSTGAPVSSRA